MFRALICPSSGVCDCVVELTHWLYCSWIAVRFGWGGIRAAGCGSQQPDTTPAEQHSDSNTQQSKNNTVNVVVQQHSRKVLKMDILMPET